MGFNLAPDLERKVLALAGKTPVRSSVVVPAPPSTNNLFFDRIVKRKIGKGQKLPKGPFGALATIRVRTAEYEDWHRRVAPKFRSLACPVAYPVRVRITLVGKWNRQRDIDNVAKPILDALVANAVLADDNLCHVTGVELRYDPDSGEAGVEVELFGQSANLFVEMK